MTAYQLYAPYGSCIVHVARVPVVVHCGSRPAPGRFTGPAVFADVLARHPRLPVVVAPLGMPEYAEFLAPAGLYESVRPDTTMAFTDFVPDPADRATIDQVPLSTCTGPAIALDLLDQPVLDAMHLAPFHAQIAAHRHILIHTGWYHQWGQEHYFTDHPVLTAAAAQLLVDAGVGLVGVDFPSVDLPPHAAHLVLLGNDVLIVENLTNLAAIGPRSFDFTAVPLALVGRDGSPVRAFARMDN